MKFDIIFGLLVPALVFSPSLGLIGTIFEKGLPKNHRNISKSANWTEILQTLPKFNYLPANVWFNGFSMNEGAVLFPVYSKKHNTRLYRF
jgi:hypothetical protein